MSMKMKRVGRATSVRSPRATEASNLNQLKRQSFSAKNKKLAQQIVRRIGPYRKCSVKMQKNTANLKTFKIIKKISIIYHKKIVRKSLFDAKTATFYEK